VSDPVSARVDMDAFSVPPLAVNSIVSGSFVPSTGLLSNIDPTFFLEPSSQELAKLLSRPQLWHFFPQAGQSRLM
jgi:hypothetical protein